MKMRPVGTNQRVLVICVKWSNVSTTRLSTGDDWIALLDDQVNTFFNRSTYNLTNFLFELPTGGPDNRWFDLGYDNTGYEFHRTGQDAIALVDPYVDFAQYNGVLVISNWQGFGGQTRSGDWFRTNEGTEMTFVEGGASVRKRQMGLSIVNEWHAHDYGEPYDEAVAVAAHELGHQLDLPTHYADVRWSPGMSRDSISPWDVMGLSPFQRHFLGWAKANRGFLAGSRIQTVGPPIGTDIDTTITLRSLELPTSSGVQLVKIPFTTGGPFLGLVAENRQQLHGDERLPGAGVLVSLVDESSSVPYGLNDLVIVGGESPGDLNTAALRVGESYTDSERNLMISVISQTDNNYDVRVQYPLPPGAAPDPAITPWGAPPYFTRDIWIDSPKNGWNTYRYVDGSGNVLGQGDDAWINHDNRVYVQIRNLGLRVATDVRVQVYINQPPGMGDAGPRWDYLGTIVFPTVPVGGTAVRDYVVWRPTVAAHTCIRAVIEAIPGELSLSNNSAQENIAAFDSTSSSPWQEVGLDINVFNPQAGSDMPVYFGVRDVPAGWAVLIDPPEMVLPPAGQGSVKFAVFPSGAPGEPETQQDHNRPGFIGMPKIEAFAPYGDTWAPIGGVDVWVHLVEATTLTIKGRLVNQIAFVEGQLIPPVQDAVVAVEFVQAAETQLEHALVNADGFFGLQIQLPADGDWSVQAFFAGDLQHAAAESSVGLLSRE